MAEYTLVNLAPFEFRFVWSMHAMFSLHQPVHVEMPTGSAFRLSHGVEPVDGEEQPFAWPRLSDGESFDQLEHLPEKRAWKLFGQDPIGKAITLRYPSRSRSLQISYTSEEAEDPLPAFWGFWVNTGGWSGLRYISVEPTTGRHDWLERCIQDGSAGQVNPSGRRDWVVRWTLGGG